MVSQVRGPYETTGAMTPVSIDENPKTSVLAPSAKEKKEKA